MCGYVFVNTKNCTKTSDKRISIISWLVQWVFPSFLLFPNCWLSKFSEVRRLQTGMELVAEWGSGMVIVHRRPISILQYQNWRFCYVFWKQLWPLFILAANAINLCHWTENDVLDQKLLRRMLSESWWISNFFEFLRQPFCLKKGGWCACVMLSK